MAKTIRPLRCPTCGSPDKTTLGPDLFRCTACQTEYYLDTDDVTVTVRHQLPPPPVPAPAPRPAPALAVAFFLLLAIGAVLWLVLLLRPGAATTSAIPVMQPIFYLTHYLYADARQQPVYVTLRTEAPRWGSDLVTLYADFFDPRTGQRRHEQVLEPLAHRLDDHTYEWHTFANGQVYLLGNQHLYRIDHRADQLPDVTNTLLANYAPASSGTAQVDFEPAHEALRFLTNDGHTFYYLPVTGQVFAEGDALYQAAEANQSRRYFSLERPAGPGLADAPYQLLRYPATGGPPLDLTNGRRFFEPRILYQAADALLIAAAPTARPDGPHLVQRLDAATGRVLWSRPASPYYFQEAVRTPNGFALGYRSGPAQDYVHGVLLLAADGQELRDFQRKRLE